MRRTENNDIKPPKQCHMLLLLIYMICIGPVLKAQLPWSSSLRVDKLLDEGWLSVADSSGSTLYQGFEQPGFSHNGWKSVSVPHNWDDYGGYIRLKHGNRHGDSWYRKSFRSPVGTAVKVAQNRSFLFFEGVGSYSRIWLNGQLIGQHRGGRTSFTLDVTPWIHNGGMENVLAVKVGHPANIRDLPWVCGGCSDEVGFSEGSQPFGIFRPVHLIQTGAVRIEPFGVHVWNDTTVNEQSAHLFLETTVKNYSTKAEQIDIEQLLLDHQGNTIAKSMQRQKLVSKEQLSVKGQLVLSNNVHLWSLQSPYLYQVKTRVLLASTNKILDELTTPYGIRWVKWPSSNSRQNGQFLLNGKPVFINGIAGYEHAIGKSHAFSEEEIRTRAEMIKAMGFNAFRDAHQPHNLRFQTYWDSTGVLWWPQFSAHIWFDTPAFKNAFLSLLKDWIIERRNSPSNIMWGLQNESKLPKAFAQQCVRLIRSLDPTASSQRPITTCNGGDGTDWNVPQNWTGTYGGDPNSYDQDLKKQLLVGEYGGWRTLDLHVEQSAFTKETSSVGSWCALLEKKIRLAAKVKDSVCGHFFWLFNAHDNPGRVQTGDGYRDLDKIGPVNYKGLLTSWEEPTDGFYLYQSNFTSGKNAPMVYIVSHNWADRWLFPGLKDGIEVYSNCDSVALFNDDGSLAYPLGIRTRAGIGSHFTWNQANIKYNTLFALGYVNGKVVAKDRIALRHLPLLPKDKRVKPSEKELKVAESLLIPAKHYSYVYRVNCGGPTYRDKLGQVWMADRAAKDAQSTGSLSWTLGYNGLPSFFASQRRIVDPIEGTVDPALFQGFRYGREKLKFQFVVPNGHYQIELYFVEPWWGKGSSMDCSGWRDFDVAVNGEIKINHLDIWKAVGSLKALKRTVSIDVTKGMISVCFPESYSGQAVISAIAVAKRNTVRENETSLDNTKSGKNNVTPTTASFNFNYPEACVRWVHPQKAPMGYAISDWLDQGDTLMVKDVRGPVTISHLPPALFGVSWIKTVGKAQASGIKKTLQLVAQIDLTSFIAVDNSDALAARMREQNLKSMGYSSTGEQVVTDRGRQGTELNSLRKVGIRLDLYQKNWQKGDTITLYPGQWSGLLAFKPLSHMQPPYDQKPETSFAVDKATYSKNGHIAMKDGKSVLEFKAIEPKAANLKTDINWVSWTFVTGVADFHALQIKYANRTKDTLKAELLLVDQSGVVLERRVVLLNPTRAGKWNSCSLDTQTMINAGHYQVKLQWKNELNLPEQNIVISSMKLR